MAKTKITAQRKRNFLVKAWQQSFETQAGVLLFENADWSTMEELDAKTIEIMETYFTIRDAIDDYYKPQIEEERAMTDYENEAEEED